MMVAASADDARPAQTEDYPSPGPAKECITALLRAEALVELTLCAAAYHFCDGTWLMFIVLFILPDVTMVCYLVNPRVGAHFYNLGHTYIAPTALALAGFVLAFPLLYLLALIWAAHIAFDRSFGFGLKFPGAFRATHLSWRTTRKCGLARLS